MVKRIIRTDAAKLWIESGILHCKLTTGSDVKIEQAKEIMKVSSILANGNKIPVLGDLSKVNSISRESRKILSGKDAKSIASSLAIIIASPISRIIGNFFMGINKPPYPVRFFSSEEKALEWLSQFRDRQRRIEDDLQDD